MSAAPIIDELVYRSYAHNRMTAPDVSPERWARIFLNGPAMEERFQREFNAGARQADDTACPGCGARGWQSYCPTCESAA